jgi:DNA polymerase III subunit epsilon
MRQVVLDTETTGLEPSQGHRVIEIGAVEIVNRRLTRRHFHSYLQPDREIDDGALAVHGITLEFLADKPRFEDVAADFIGFIGGAELVIHNVPFDVPFLNLELGRLHPRPGQIEDLCTVLDSLTLARRKHPGQKNTLDALCRRYGIDNAQRNLHGALLDAELLADVYLAMTGGQTVLFAAEIENGDDASSHENPAGFLTIEASRLRVVRASLAEIVAHEAHLDMLDQAAGGGSIWRRGASSLTQAQ